MIVRRTAQFAGYLCLRIVLCLTQALPLSMCHTAAGVLAKLFCDVLRVRRKVIDENLLHAFPAMSTAQRRLLARRMWEHLLLFIAETAHSIRKLHPTNYHRYVRFRGEVP